jgi:hypothetical protein
MSDDLRCCGTGTCIINAEGLCWCGQQWDGEKMCFPVPSGDHNSLDSAQQTALSQPDRLPVKPQDN